MRYFIASFILVCIFFVFLSGKLLDQEGDRVIKQLYPRDKHGIIEGMQTITNTKNYPTALVLLHGFQSSPAIWADLINDIQDKIQADIYAPLLPFHGKDLRTLTKLDVNILKAYLNNKIQTLSKHYQTLTIVGFSMSGALLAELADTQALPKNVQIILYNPALYLNNNTPQRRLEMHLYSLWRQYSNYPNLGSRIPNYASGDIVARPKIARAKSLQYDVVPAALEVYQLDAQTQRALEKIRIPYHLIIAKDDNYSDYNRQKKACYLNQPRCHLHTFESGRHLIHWGAHKVAFENLMVNLVKSASSNFRNHRD